MFARVKKGVCSLPLLPFSAKVGKQRAECKETSKVRSLDLVNLSNNDNGDAKWAFSKIQVVLILATESLLNGYLFT